MAEPAGLVIGAVALTTMFTSCVELADYIELGKSYATDHVRACTKLDLLKTRLWTWGEDLNISQPGYEAYELRCCWAQKPKQEVITSSLWEIQAILENVRLLTNRSKPLKRLQKDLRLLTAGTSQTIISCENPDHRLKSTGASLGAWKRFSWAISYKKKIDCLLGDLEFFINNLEEVIERTMEPTPAEIGTKVKKGNTYNFKDASRSKFLQGDAVDAKGSGECGVHQEYNFENTIGSEFYQSGHDQKIRDAFLKPPHGNGEKSEKETSITKQHQQQLPNRAVKREEDKRKEENFTKIDVKSVMDTKD